MIVSMLLTPKGMYANSEFEQIQNPTLLEFGQNPHFFPKVSVVVVSPLFYRKIGI